MSDNLSVKPKHAGGRPSTYTLDMAERICEAIAVGGAVHIFTGQNGFPTETTVYKWLERHQEFAQLYARARRRQADREAAEIILIADTEPDPNRAKVRIDARKWHASKLDAPKYGDRIQNVHTGADGGAVKVETVSPIDEIEQRLQRISERAEVHAEAKPGAGRVIN